MNHFDDFFLIFDDFLPYTSGSFVLDYLTPSLFLLPLASEEVSIVLENGLRSDGLKHFLICGLYRCCCIATLLIATLIASKFLLINYSVYWKMQAFCILYSSDVSRRKRLSCKDCRCFKCLILNQSPLNVCRGHQLLREYFLRLVSFL